MTFLMFLVMVLALIVGYMGWGVISSYEEEQYKEWIKEKKKQEKVDKIRRKIETDRLGNIYKRRQEAQRDLSDSKYAILNKKNVTAGDIYRVQQLDKRIEEAQSIIDASYPWGPM